jgi:hypothetical protein
MFSGIAGLLTPIDGEDVNVVRRAAVDRERGHDLAG